MKIKDLPEDFQERLSHIYNFHSTVAKEVEECIEEAKTFEEAKKLIWENMNTLGEEYKYTKDILQVNKNPLDELNVHIEKASDPGTELEIYINGLYATCFKIKDMTPEMQVLLNNTLNKE